MKYDTPVVLDMLRMHGTYYAYGGQAMTIVRTTFQVPQLLLHRLKVQAAREQTDMLRLLCKIAEGYLGVHEKEPLDKRQERPGLPRDDAG